jgi:outer membrane murein-binding lipoprotein Lpp
MRIRIAAAALTLTALAGCSSTPVTTTPVTVTQEAPTTDVADVASMYRQWTTDYQVMIDEFTDAADNADFAGTAAALIRVGEHAQAGKDLPDLPGLPAVNREWDAAMDDLITASEVGAPALLARDIEGIQTATTYIGRSSVHIKAATAALP